MNVINDSGNTLIITVGTQLGYTTGNSVVVADVTNPKENRFEGTVNSYNIGNGTIEIVDITNIKGDLSEIDKDSINTLIINLDGIDGPQGPKGATGSQGPRGATGLQGIQGPTGSQGIQGPTGLQGLKGATGLQGQKGATGTKGATGAPGVGSKFISNNKKDLNENLETTLRLKNVYGNQLTMEKLLKKKENIYGQDKEFFGAEEVTINSYDDTITFIGDENSESAKDIGTSIEIDGTGTGNGTLTKSIVDNKITSESPNGLTVTITGYTSINTNAFKENEKIKKVVIDNSVKSIGTGAFYSCNNLESVTLLDNSNLKTIDSQAFVNCSKLKSIIIPDSVTKINSYSFKGCSKLKSVTFGENSNLESIGDSAFSECSTLESISIPDTVKDIKQQAFRECSSLSSVKLPTNDEFKVIEKATFRDCSITSIIDIPDSVETIGEYAFLRCSKLESINFNNTSNLKTINDNAFRYCTALTRITIPNTVTAIDSEAFKDCTSLTEVIISEETAGKLQVTAGSEKDFLGATGVTITITSIKEITLDGTGILTKDIVDAALKDQPNDLAVTITITGYTSIDSLAFSENKKINTVVIGNSVTEIKQDAFKMCSNLTSVTFEEQSDLENMGVGVFAGCTKLKEVNIPDSVTQIEGSVFADCTGLITVTGGNGLQSISKYAFSKCSKLSSVNIGNSVTTINSRAFWLCSSLTSVNIPSSVETIGKNAFNGCSDLSSVYIFGNVTELDNTAFKGCNKLKNLHLSGAMLTRLDVQVGDIKNVLGLTDVTIRSLKEITLDGTGILTKDIVDTALKDQPNDLIVTIIGYTSIGITAFNSQENNEKIKEVIISNSVTSIKQYAF